MRKFGSDEEIEVWLNGEYMGIINDDMTSMGKIGIWGVACHVLIDNVKITEIKK